MATVTKVMTRGMASVKEASVTANSVDMRTPLRGRSCSVDRGDVNREALRAHHDHEMGMG